MSEETEKKSNDQDREQMKSIQRQLLESRKIFLTDEVNMELANQVMSQLFVLDEKGQDPITIYINSPGGDLTSGMAIYDTIHHIGSSVSTVCTGLSASVATIILAGGTRGERKSFPNSRILIHQPLGGFRGQAADIEIHAREILRAKENLNRILSDDTGQSFKKIEKDTHRDFWMSAEEAKEYGIIDTIL